MRYSSAIVEAPRVFCCSYLAGRTRRSCHLGQTKIQNLGVSTFRHKDISRLDVPMDNTLRMGDVQGVGNLDGQRQQSFQFHWPVTDQVLKGVALQILHGNECLAVFLSDVMDGADVGMIQSRRRFRFAAKALQGRPILRPCLPAGISKLQSDLGGCPQPCTPRPSHRRQASRRCDSARWFDLSTVHTPSIGRIVGPYPCQVKLQ